MNNMIKRKASATDIPLLYAAWLKGLYYGNPFMNEIDKEVFFKNYKPVVTNIMLNCTVEVACLEDEPDVVVGFIVYKLNVLHWVYTKRNWRKLGVSKLLMPQGIDTVTHLTRIGKSLKPGNWKFNPFVI